MLTLKKTYRQLIAIVLICTLSMLPVTNVCAANASTSIATGIDVSKHNGAINWNAVAASGISFAFIKAGSTYSGVDPYFAANMTGAAAAGLHTGVYLYSYATNVQEAQNEALLLLQWIGNYTVSYPVAYDIEDAVHKAKSPAELAAMVNIFCSTVAAAGYYPIVYSSKNWFNDRIGAVAFDKWVAQYNDNCEYSNNLCFWQATSHGAIAGVPTRVDLNYQYKDYSTLIISDGFLPRYGQTLFFAGYKMQKGWIAFNNTRYLTDANGYLQKNIWFTDTTGTYYLTPADGSIARGPYNVNGLDYFFNETGAKVTGWVPINGLKYYYDPTIDGSMRRGWFADTTGTYYLAADGHAVFGPLAVDGQNYYFDANCVRQTGWLALPTGTFYYDPTTGAMVKGWFADTNGQHYLSPDDGHMLIGEAVINKQNYFFNEKGIMQVGYVTLPTGTFYFDPATGVKLTGWLPDATGTHYLSTDNGHMVVGPATIAKSNYYFDAKGIMQVGLVVRPDGMFFYDRTTGANMTGWILDGVLAYYAGTDGRIVTGLNTIKGVTYYFNEKGELQVNQTVVLGGVTYLINELGVATAVTAAPAAATTATAATTTKK